MRLVVIGAVAAGMSAASQAKRRSKDLEVVVLERGQDVSYGACGMPYNLADPVRKVEDLVVMTAAEFRDKRGIDLRLGHEVKEIDRERRRVRWVSEAGPFEVEYDALVLATGSRAVMPPVPGIETPGVFPLRTLRDLAGAKKWIADRPCRDGIVIGGSYLGLELAEALTARGLRVTMVKRSPGLLSALPPEFDEMVRQELTRNGVELIHGHGIKRIGADGRLTMELDDRKLSADIIMVATGFAPRSELGLAAGLAVGPSQAIAVDEYGRTSDPRIFAAGDCADNLHAVSNARVWSPLALHANRTGRIVGANASGASEVIPPVAGTIAVRVFGLETASAGLTPAQAKTHGFTPVSETIRAKTRAHSFPGAKDISVNLVADKNTGRLLGGAVVGAERAALRIDVIATAIHAGMSVANFADLDLMYSPPLAPAWDPLLLAASQLMKKTAPRVEGG
jgi:CoA-dependent NAD(P)H sulfur oxidoreductase